MRRSWIWGLASGSCLANKFELQTNQTGYPGSSDKTSLVVLLGRHQQNVFFGISGQTRCPHGTMHLSSFSATRSTHVQRDATFLQRRYTGHSPFSCLFSASLAGLCIEERTWYMLNANSREGSWSFHMLGRVVVPQARHSVSASTPQAGGADLPGEPKARRDWVRTPGGRVFLVDRGRCPSQSSGVLV